MFFIEDRIAALTLTFSFCYLQFAEMYICNVCNFNLTARRVFCHRQPGMFSCKYFTNLSVQRVQICI